MSKFFVISTEVTLLDIHFHLNFLFALFLNICLKFNRNLDGNIAGTVKQALTRLWKIRRHIWNIRCVEMNCLVYWEACSGEPGNRAFSQQTF